MQAASISKQKHDNSVKFMISDDFFNIETNVKRIYSQIYAQKIQTTPHAFDDVQDLKTTIWKSFFLKLYRVCADQSVAVAWHSTRNSYWNSEISWNKASHLHFFVAEQMKISNNIMNRKF